MTTPPLRVELAKGLAERLETFDAPKRGEIADALAGLTQDPQLGRDTIRLRDRYLPQPLFYRALGAWGAYLTIREDRLIVLDMVERPRLRLPRPE